MKADSFHSKTKITKKLAPYITVQFDKVLLHMLPLLIKSKSKHEGKYIGFQIKETKSSLTST